MAGAKREKLPVEASAEEKKEHGLDYDLHSSPPGMVTALYVIQLLLANLSGPLGAVYFIHATVCASDSPVLLAELISTALFMGGLATLLQVTLGVRLSIVQGSSWAFIPPIVAMMNTEKWRCPPSVPSTGNGTCGDVNNGTICELDPWQPRLNEINGGLLVASALHMLLGLSGAAGALCRHLGPLTVAPAVALLGLTLVPTVARAAQHSWGVAMGTLVLYIVCSQILHKVSVPFPAYQKGRGFFAVPINVFKVFPNMFVIALMWLVCYVCTLTGQFPQSPADRGYLARTDAKVANIQNMKWFFFPYPGRLGWPSVSGGAPVVGMLAAVVCSVVESVGDYHATAAACDVTAPPPHAVNRGVAVEGVASLLSGLLGAGHATTSYSGNIGIIRLTGFASRQTWQVYGVTVMLLAVFGKFAAALSIIPDPIIGGLSLAGLGMLVGVALSSLRHVELRSSRNLLILGTALMLGLLLPDWVSANAGAIDTGSPELDQALVVFLSTGMFVGGTFAFILDNLLPGSRQERGLRDKPPTIQCNDRSPNDTESSNVTPSPDPVYDLPFLSEWIHSLSVCSYLPFMPSYLDRNMCGHCCCCKKSRIGTDGLQGSEDMNVANVGNSDSILETTIVMKM